MHKKLLSYKLNFIHKINLKKMQNETVEAFRKMGIKELTPVQKKLNHIYQNTKKSIIVQSKNGTGKTIGTLYSTLRHFDTEKDKILMVVLPTRELAYQIFNQINMVNSAIKGSGFRVKLCIGGLSLKEDQKSIQRLDPNIIVGMPYFYFWCAFIISFQGIIFLYCQKRDNLFFIEPNYHTIYFKEYSNCFYFLALNKTYYIFSDF